MNTEIPTVSIFGTPGAGTGGVPTPSSSQQSAACVSRTTTTLSAAQQPVEESATTTGSVSQIQMQDDDNNDDNDNDNDRSKPSSSNSPITKAETERASSKLDLLAGKILESSGLLSTPFITRYIHRRLSRQNTHNGEGEEGEECRNTAHYLSALELVLEIHHRTKKELFAAHENDEDDDVGEELSAESSSSATLLTCTPSAHHSFSAVNRDTPSAPTRGGGVGKYWTPPELKSMEDGEGGFNALSNHNEEEEEEVPSLEEAAPFSPSFYTYVGYFMVCAYNPTAFKPDTDAATSPPNHHHNPNTPPPPQPNHHQPPNTNSITSKAHILSRELDAIRATRILWALMELNVLGCMDGGGGGAVRRYYYRNSVNDCHAVDKVVDGFTTFMTDDDDGEGGSRTRKRKSGSDVGDTIEDSTALSQEEEEEVETHENIEDYPTTEYPPNHDITFLDILLYYTENDNTLTVTNQPRPMMHHNSSHTDNDPTGGSNGRKKRKAVPFIHALFRHISSLPQLEGQVHSMCRVFRNGGDGSNTQSSSSSNHRRIHHHNNSNNTTQSSTAAKIRLMKLTQTYRTYLDEELKTHTSHLESILQTIYRRADVPLRRRMRVKIGSGFQNFLLVSEGGNIGGGGVAGGGGGVGAFGVENTIAAGIDLLLKVLLRILRGITPIPPTQNGDSKTTTTSPLQESHRDLLQSLLIPLHKPSGMVLWRDQTPLLGLYHRSLVQCIGALVSLEKGLVGRVVRGLLHPTVWPLEGSSSSQRGKGGGGGNTPKVVLLLHEIDTYIGLLDLPDSKLEGGVEGGDKMEGADGGGGDVEEEEGKGGRLPLSDTMLPLVMRLASCISSDNSRTSERALEFFKNRQFERLVRLHVKSVMTPMLRSLCRVEHGMEVPWNPTVRKMTLIVLKDLESYDSDRFRQSCEEIFSRELRSVEDGGVGADGSRGGEEGGEEDKGSSVAVSFGTQHRDIVATPTSDMISLRSAMGSWKPPDKSSASGSSSMSHNRRRTTAAPAPRCDNITMGSMPPPKSRNMGSRSSLPSLSSSRQGGSRKEPPLTVTGVAPWAMMKSAPSAKVGMAQPSSQLGANGGKVPNLPNRRLPSSSSSLPRSMGRSSSGMPQQLRQQPPSVITGVAPWAIAGAKNGGGIGALGGELPKKKLTGGGGDNGDRSKSNRGPSCCFRTNKDGSEDDDNQSTDTDTSRTTSQSNPQNPGELRVRSYILKLRPPMQPGDNDDPSSSDDGISTWARAQMSESPVLLPTLKFHDLVFGQTLGTGAFSTVKYARRIVRSTTRSNWPEYAVKIVSTEKIISQGYTQSINREIAILHTLSHPGIARLISSFRFRDGTYLILEYASGGDLHTLIRRNGSLSPISTRYVIGQIVAALVEVHGLGLVYGDLKPENVLVMETGHVKITDFGACRPLTEEARLRVGGKDMVKTLRDGDWRTIVSPDDNDAADDKGGGWPQSNDGNDEHLNKQETEEEEDIRIEGTTAYLPPEVVLGNFPDPSADSWALGCVLFQCLSGRPPLLGDDERSTRRKIVAFDLPSDTNNATHDDDDDDFFLKREGITAFDEPTTIKPLILSLLNRSPTDRPTMIAVSNSPFFESTDIFSYHRLDSIRLDVGAVKAPGGGMLNGESDGEGVDSRWSRRQFSSIWAPQPGAYRVGIGVGDGESGKGKTRIGGMSSEDGVILEGEEAASKFLVGGGGKDAGLAVTRMLEMIQEG